MVVWVAVVAAVGAASAAERVAVEVDAGVRRQTIEGFGTCMIGWGKAMPERYRTRAFQEFYVQTMGCSVLRVAMWPTTLTRPVEDPDAITYKDFKLDDRATIYLDLARALRRQHPQMRIIASCWSPPAWMKVNRRIKGDGPGGIRAHDYRGSDNRIDPRYIEHYAAWLVEMARQYRDLGAPLYAISPGNEVMFTQGFESCQWTADDYAKIVVALGRRLEAAGMGDVLIFGPETMTHHVDPGGTLDYVETIMRDPEAAHYLDRWATHGYVDGLIAEFSATSAGRFYDAIAPYGKPAWMTEAGTGEHRWPKPVTEGVATALHNGLVAGEFSMYVPWQVIDRKPTTHTLATLDGPTKKTYAAMQFFRYIRPDAVRVEATPAFGRLLSSAYVHDEHGLLTVVLINTQEGEAIADVSWDGVDVGDVVLGWRTSADEDMAAIRPTRTSANSAAVVLQGQSIVTLVARMRADGP